MPDLVPAAITAGLARPSVWDPDSMTPWRWVNRPVQCRTVLGGVLAALLFLSANAASAATYFAEATIGSNVQSRLGEDPTRAVLRSAAGGLARAQASAGVVSAQAETERNARHAAEAGFEETYRIVGLSSEPVPVILTALVSFRGQGVFETRTAFDVVQDGSDRLDLEYDLSRAGSRRILSRRASVRREVWLAPNVDFVFSLQSFATARRGFAAATVSRPFLRLDPAYAGDYRLARASDLPMGAVPEPGTWAMLILGFGGIGAVLRRGGAARLTAGSL